MKNLYWMKSGLHLMKSGMIGTTSLIWSAGSQFSRGLAYLGLIQSKKLDARVVSVGNLQVGGAGKTPLVAQIAREVVAKNLTVCILCRGYKSLWEKRGGVLLPGNFPADPLECGDEPALLHELVPEAYIGVGANRFSQFQKVRTQANQKIDWVILDDGFQNHQIYKNLEIVALTSASPMEILFRDFFKSLRWVNLVVWTKGEVSPDFQGRPSCRIQYQLPPPPLQKKFWLVTGVADGKSVYDLMIIKGYLIQRNLQFGDHARYDQKMISNILQQASADDCTVVLTGKDWVKWRNLGIEKSKVLVLEPELIFLEGQEIWSQILWGS